MSKDTTTRCGSSWTDAASHCYELCTTNGDCLTAGRTSCFNNLPGCAIASLASPAASNGSKDPTMRCGASIPDAENHCYEFCTTSFDCPSPFRPGCFPGLTTNACGITTTNTVISSRSSSISSSSPSPSPKAASSSTTNTTVTQSTSTAVSKSPSSTQSVLPISTSRSSSVSSTSRTLAQSPSITASSESTSPSSLSSSIRSISSPASRVSSMEASPETSRTATSSAIVSEDSSSGPNVGLIVGCVIGVLLAIVFLVLFWNLKKSGKLTTVGSWLPKPKRRESDMDVVEKGAATRAIAGETGAAAASAASSPKVTLDFLDQLNRVDTVDRPNSEGTSNKSYATDSVDRAPPNATTTPSMISWVPSDSSNPVPPSMVRQDALPSQTPVYMESHDNHISEQASAIQPPPPLGPPPFFHQTTPVAQDQNPSPTSIRYAKPLPTPPPSTPNP